MSFECLEKCNLEEFKLMKFVRAHVYTFEDVILCVCSLQAPLPAYSPLSQCWDLRGPIKAGLPATPASAGPLH